MNQKKIKELQSSVRHCLGFMSAHVPASNSQNVINGLRISNQMLFHVIVFYGRFCVFQPLGFLLCLFVFSLSCSLSLRRALEEAPLMTQSLREAQRKEKIDRYPKVSLLHVRASTLILPRFPMWLTEVVA